MSAYELARLFVCFKPTIDGRAVTGGRGWGVLSKNLWRGVDTLAW